MKPSRARSYATLALVLLVGCTVDDYEGCQPNPRGGSPCVTTSPDRFAIDCGQNFQCDLATRQCVYDRVLAPCDTDPARCTESDPDETLTCVMGRCRVRGGEADVCGSADDCLGRLDCVDGRCQRTLDCAGDDHCWPAEVCHEGRCRGGDRCTDDEDCDPGATCDEVGVCRFPACTEGEVCEGGRVCVGGMCAPCDATPERCGDALACGRRGLCVGPGNMDAPCADDEDCAGYCDTDDGFCRNGMREIFCGEGLPECEVPLFCFPDQDSVAGECVQGERRCRWHPWSDTPTEGCEEGRVCVPEGAETEFAESYAACADDPSSCVGARGQCRNPGSRTEGPCLSDEACKSGACLEVPTLPASVIPFAGFVCDGGECVYALPWSGFCAETCLPEDGCVGDPPVRVGEDCTGDRECMEPTICDGRVCVTENSVPLGVRCRGQGSSRMTSRCAHGLRCLADGLCHAVGTAELGEACTMRDDCIDAIFEGEDLDMDGRPDDRVEIVCDAGFCARAPLEGESCGAERICGRDTLVCDRVARVCVRGDAEIGEPCAELGCGVGSHCDATETCVVAPLPGEPCDSSAPCPAGYACQDDRCQSEP